MQICVCLNFGIFFRTVSEECVNEIFRAAVKEKVLAAKAFYQKEGWQRSLMDNPGLSSYSHRGQLRENICADVVSPLVLRLLLIYFC